MTGFIINILQQSKHYGISETVEIAKGKNKLPETYSEVWSQFIRKLKTMHLPKD